MKRSIVLITMLFITLFATACDASTANIPNAVLAKDYKDGKAVEPGTATFGPSDTIHAVVSVANAPDNTKIKAVWTVVDAGDGQIKDQKAAEKEFLSKDIGSTVDFTFVPDKPLPTGKYKADIYLDDKLDKTLNFEIK